MKSTVSANPTPTQEIIDDSFIDPRFKTASGTDGVIWCASVKRSSNKVEMTGTKAHNEGKVLEFDRGEWKAFIEGVKAGEFDV